MSDLTREQVEAYLVCPPSVKTPGHCLDCEFEKSCCDEDNDLRFAIALLAAWDSRDELLVAARALLDTQGGWGTDDGVIAEYPRWLAACAALRVLVSE